MSSELEIQFFSETKFALQNQGSVANWLSAVVESEERSLGFLNFVFLDDDALLEINKKYLQHDYYTDVISFDYSEEGTISGEIYISIDRVKDNANSLKKDFNEELYRVMVHGLLHFLGYQDKQAEDKLVMGSKEDYYLNLQTF